MSYPFIIMTRSPKKTRTNIIKWRTKYIKKYAPVTTPVELCQLIAQFATHSKYNESLYRHLNCNLKIPPEFIEFDWKYKFYPSKKELSFYILYNNTCDHMKRQYQYYIKYGYDRYKFGANSFYIPCVNCANMLYDGVIRFILPDIIDSNSTFTIIIK